MMKCVLWTCGTTKRASAADGVDAAPARAFDIAPVAVAMASIAGGPARQPGATASHGRRNDDGARRRRRRQAGAGGAYLPSSNTTSRLTDTLLSPVATGVLSISAFIAIVRIIGIGRTPPPLPSEMLTMRRTRRPSDLA